jgi:hypothetical protein
MGVDPNTGALTQQDYFEPYVYDSDNGGDLDFGSAGVSLLDPTIFYGTGVSRIAVAGGKDGKVYIMNADNLGGFAGGKQLLELHLTAMCTNNIIGTAGADFGMSLRVRCEPSTNT